MDARLVHFLAEPDGARTGLTISVAGYRAASSQTYERAVYLLLDRMLGEHAVESGSALLKS
jgi:hypothetical protein